jgi:glutaredoxin
MTGKVPVGSDESVTRNPGKVVMFSRSNEGHSRKLRNFFNKYKITYTDYIIDKDEEAKRRFELTGGTSAPLVFVGSRRFYGCNYEFLQRSAGE